jgi:hypothetical protein
MCVRVGSRVLTCPISELLPLPVASPPLGPPTTLNPWKLSLGKSGAGVGWCQGGVCDYWSQTRPDHFPWLWPWTLTFATVRGV